MRPVDIDMLEFAAEWAPYGGNPEAAFLRFGLTPDQFHRRLTHLLTTPAAHTLHPTTRALLHAQCAASTSP